jgi:putative DNA primase/helicase
MPLRAIVRAVGGDLYDGGRRANVPAPGHSPLDRSSPSCGLANGWSCTVLARPTGAKSWTRFARGLIDASGAPTDASTEAPLRRSPAERVAMALALWTAARKLTGTLAERHLRLLHVERPSGGALGYHPAVRAAVYADAGPTKPALLAVIVDPDGALTAVDITCLDSSGRQPCKGVAIFAAQSGDEYCGRHQLVDRADHLPATPYIAPRLFSVDHRLEVHLRAIRETSRSSGSRPAARTLGF